MQSSIASRRRKGLKLEDFKVNRLCTPYPIIVKKRERSVSFGQKEGAVKRKFIEGIETRSPHLISFPSLRSGNSLVDRRPFSSIELMRASEAVLSQVDWSKVVLDVSEKARPANFKDAFTDIMQARIKELLKQEADGETSSDTMTEENTSVTDEEDEMGSDGYVDEEDKRVQLDFLADSEEEVDDDSDDEYQSTRSDDTDGELV